MADHSLLEKFHLDVRVNYTADPGYQLVREAPVLRLVSLNKNTPFNMILCSTLDDHNADAVIEREVNFFRKRNEPFEWKLFSYDSPKDLAERLTLHGLKEADEESLMVAPLGSFKYESALNSHVTVSKIEDEITLTIFLQTVNEDETNPEHLEALRRSLLTHLREAKDSVGIYGASWDGKPVSLGWAFYPPNSRFCGLFGGTTLTAFRGKGLYRRLVQARAEEARKKGFSFLFVDAGPMSRPILEKLGFSELCKMKGFHWYPY